MTCDLAQSREALLRANEVRAAKVAIKVELRSLPPREACLHAADMLDDPNAVIGAMPVSQLLRAIPRLGETGATQMLIAADVRVGDRHIRDLTPRQRGVLSYRLWARAERYK